MQGPIVIGGLGGSGTRVFALLLQRLGVHIGPVLNHALDNLWFTLLCKRPRWVAAQRAEGGHGIQDALACLAVAMTGTGRPPPNRHAATLAAAESDWDRGDGGAGADADALASLRAPPPPPAAAWWGWKEPNSHLVLPELLETFPDLRYIHVVRHGLDMAFSGNRGQLGNWGPQAGIAPPPGPEGWPAAQFRFWVWANDRAMAVGSERLGGRFRCLQFESCCRDPAGTLRELAGLIGVQLDPACEQALSAGISLPASVGRFQAHNRSWVTEADRAALRRFGYADAVSG